MGRPVNKAIRPLDKGVILNKTPAELKPGELTNAQNCIITRRGIKRRPSYLRYDGGTVDDDELYLPLTDLLVFWRIDGTQYTIALDDKFLYSLDTAGDFTRKTWVYDTGTITATAGTSTIEGAGGCLWDTAASAVQAGDVIVLDVDESGNGPEFCTISSITDDDTLEVVGDLPAEDHAGGTDYEIRRAWGAADPFLVDWTIAPDEDDDDDGILLLADSSRGLYKFDGATFAAHSDQTYIPTCVTFFKERLWMGRITESGDEYRQRIRWTEAGDYDDWTNGGYIDLPYTQGAIQRLVPLGKTLIAYFNDAIFVGLQTNQPTLPIAFQRFETGGRGLTGMKAVVPYKDGHFIVCQDDIYFFSLTRGLEPIGNPVVKRTLEECDEERYWKIYAAHDLLNKCVLFGLPKAGEEFEEIWAYNYESNAWSPWSVSGDFLSHSSITGVITWGSAETAAYETGLVTTVDGDETVEGDGDVAWDAAGAAAGDTILIDVDDDSTYSFESTIDAVTDDDTLEMVDACDTDAADVAFRIVAADSQWVDQSQTWEQQMPSSLLAGNTFFSVGEYIYYFTEAGDLDLDTTAPTVVIETGDIDEGLPALTKTWLDLGVKLEDLPSTELTFYVSGSVDRGRTWKTLGTIDIDTDADEGRTSFRLTGSAARFRLTSNSEVSPYILAEITYRLTTRGREVPGRDS